MIENIDIIKSHPLQALIQAGHQVFAGAPLAVWAWPHIISGLAGDDHLIAVRLEVFLQDRTESLFRRPRRRSVVIGKVEVGDSQIERSAHHRSAVLKDIVAAEVMPQPEGNRRQLQAAASAAVIFHVLVSFRVCRIHTGQITP
ncbi:hypothetical protein D3C73_1337320 [compost metagenome]